MFKKLVIVLLSICFSKLIFTNDFIDDTKDEEVMSKLELATYQTKSYIIENGEEMNKEYPETFFIPSRKIRESLKVGNIVKLMFRMITLDGNDRVSVERMWVVIDDITRSGTYVGTLDNEPYGNVELKAGDKVIFSPEHIIQIYDE